FALSGEKRARAILPATVIGPARVSPRPRCNGRSVLITISRPMGVILNPTSSATGAYVTLANSSSGVVAGRLPTDTPDELKSIDRRTVTIRSLQLRSGMTTNQLDVDICVDLVVRAFKLAMNTS